MVQYPIFLKDKDGYMLVIPSEDKIVWNVEENDIYDNEYFGWDSSGRSMKAKLVNEEIHFNELKQAISNYAKILNKKIINPDEFKDAEKMFEAAEKK